MRAVDVRIRIAPGATLGDAPATWPWQDITADWVASEDLAVEVGADDEQPQGQAQGELTLNNGESKTTGSGAGIVGRYTQDNPASDLWPLWTLACPVEIAYDWGTGFNVAAILFTSALELEWPDGSGRRPRVKVWLGGRLRQEQIGAEARSAMVSTTLAQTPTCLWALEQDPGSQTGGEPMAITGLVDFSGTPVAAGGGGAANFSEGGYLWASTKLAGATIASWEAECVVGVDELPTSFPGSDIRRIVAWQTPQSVVNEIGVSIAFTGTVWALGGFYSVDGSRANLFSSLDAAIEPGKTYHVRLTVAPYIPDTTQIHAIVYVNGVYAGQNVMTGVVKEPTAVGVNYAIPQDLLFGRPPANFSSISQIALWTPWRSVVPDRVPPMLGYASEEDQDRIIRLCTERGVPYAVTGTRGIPMGPQPVDAFVPLLRDCEAAGRGIIDDSRGVIGYRTVAQLYNTDPVFVIDGSAWELGANYSPTLDDQRARSATRATRTGGSVYVDSGRTPRYTGGLAVNVANDVVLTQAASWRNHEGRLTTRYPSIGAPLHSAPQLIPTLMAVRLGDTGRLRNPPRAHAPGNRLLQVRGIRSRRRGTRGEWDWTANAVAGELYEVYQVQTGSGNRSRINPGTSTTDASYGPAVTTLSVTSTQVRWIDSATYPSQFGPTKPMLVVIAGEVVLVNSIVGTGLTQTFNVTRAQTGFAKTLPAGSLVTLHRAPVTAY